MCVDTVIICRHINEAILKEKATAVDSILIDKVLSRNQPAQSQNPYVKLAFWHEKVINQGKDNERYELKIDYRKFIEFLHNNGFGLLIQEKQVQIVRVHNNIVSHTLEKGHCNLRQWLVRYYQGRQ